MNNVVTTLAPSFLIGSSSFFQVTRPTIRALMSLKFGRIRLSTDELAARYHLEIPHRLIMGKCCDYSSAFNFRQIFIIIAGNITAWMKLNLGKVPSLTGVSCP